METPQQQAVIQAALARFESKEKTRILAFGSSNTEHRILGTHWFDVFDLALKKKYGRFHHCINTGIGGDTTAHLLARFEEDAAFYRPHLVFLTVGGNDFRKIDSVEQIRDNYRELHRRFAALGTPVIFQTYYSPDPERTGPLERFFEVMEIMREVAAETGSGLIDQLRRWELFRNAAPQQYAPLMMDGFHVNERGNRLMGLELTAAFGIGEVLCEQEELAEAREIQALINRLDPRKR
ncbi:MAG TPA: SGNH/GDSL hydrolase family protein [Chthoniobacteraceae bacterium]|nr:SGNH/GDSL hydrolase family protein [Chthoniobacteraceae bacterium]